MGRWQRIGALLLCALDMGCVRSSAATTVPSPPIAYRVEPLGAERLASLESHAPELARNLQRLNALAQEHGLRGEEEEAREMATLAEVSLLSAELAFAQSACAPANEAVSTEAPEEADASVTEAQGDSTRRRRTRVAPTVSNEAPAASMVDPEDTVRARMAEMVAVLGEMEPGPYVEQVQRMLIEADRALAEGLVERAAELTEEARAALSGARMQRVSDAEAFMRDAQEHLGSRALRRGSRILVRLNNLVAVAEGRWNTRDASTMSSLRSLARVYRGERLMLVHVAEADDSAFVQGQDGLLTYLRERMQLSSERLGVAARQSSGAQGTYLVFRPESD